MNNTLSISKFILIGLASTPKCRGPASIIPHVQGAWSGAAGNLVVYPSIHPQLESLAIIPPRRNVAGQLLVVFVMSLTLEQAIVRLEYEEVWSVTLYLS